MRAKNATNIMKTTVKIQNGQILVDGSNDFSVCASVKDLSALGWVFDWGNGDEAEELQEKGYWVLIEVENGKTSYTVLSDNNQGGIKEDTGDDEQTIKDLIQLHNEGNLWDFRSY